MSETLLLIVILFIQLTALFFISRTTINEIFLFLYSLIHEKNIVYGIVALIFFPGTVIHELAHFFAAIILFLRVREINLIPEWTDNSIKLGHVIYEKKDIARGILVGIAPIPAGVLFFWAMYVWNLFPNPNIWLTILLGYIIFSVSTTMFSSKQDLIDIAYVVPIFIILGIVWFIFRDSLLPVFSFIGQNLVNYDRSIREFIYSVNVYVFFSLLIHIGIIAVLKLPKMLRHRHHSQHHYHHH